MTMVYVKFIEILYSICFFFQSDDSTASTIVTCRYKITPKNGTAEATVMLLTDTGSTALGM